MQAKLLIGHGNLEKKIFAEASDGEIKMLVGNSSTRNTKNSRNDVRAFALKNQSEGYKANKSLSGLMVYWRIMPAPERLFSEFASCPRSFASRPNDHFLDNLSIYSSVQVYIAMYSLGLGTKVRIFSAFLDFKKTC